MKNRRVLKNGQNVIVIGLLLAIVVSCDAWVRVPGRIVDESGKPIHGARITVYIVGAKLSENLSNTDGRFDILENVSPISTSTIKVVVSKEGFVTREFEFDARELPVNPNVDPNLPKERIFTLARQI